MRETKESAIMSYGSSKNLEGKRNRRDAEREGLLLYLLGSLQSWEQSVNKTLTIFPKWKRKRKYQKVQSLMFQTD